MAEYKSKFTGAEIDDGIAKARAAVVMQGGDTLTWDGNTEGLVSVADMLYKVSDAVPTADDVANGATASALGFPSFNAEFSDMGNGILFETSGTVVIVPDSGVGIDLEGGFSFPEAGTYFNGSLNVRSLTIPGYTGFGQEKIAPSHLYQPDWNQNDATQPDYVKNRTHYSEYGEVFLMAETEVVGSEEDGMYSYYLGVSAFSGEESLTITFDGVPYECNLQNLNDMWVYGNAAPFGGVGSEEPFAFVIMPGQMAALLMLDAEQHTVAISSWQTIYHRIPTAYVDTRKIFYVGFGSYIYTDASCSIKATKDEVAAAMLENNIVFKAGGIMVVPVMVDTVSKDYAIARVTMNYGTEPSWVLLYTAEYVPETT